MSQSAISELEATRGQRFTQALADFHALARAEAAGETKKGDGQRLDEALNRAGKSLDDFHTAVGLCRRHAELQAIGGQKGERDKAFHAAQAELREYNNATAELMRDRQEGAAELRRLAAEASGPARQSRVTLGEANELEQAHPDFLESMDVKLAQYTLVDEAGGTVINVSANDAPHRAVGPTVFASKLSAAIRSCSGP